MQPIKRLALIASLSALALPAMAEPWGADYHMGTFIAFGGSDAEGRIALECVDPESGQSSAGTLFVSFTPAAESIPKKSLPDIDIVGLKTDDAPALPISVTRDGTTLVLKGDMNASTARSLLHMLRVGDTLAVTTASNPSFDIGNISLEGSTAALDGFEACAD